MGIKLKEFETVRPAIVIGIGTIEIESYKDLPFHARRWDGEEKWFSKRQDAMDFITEGLIKPTPFYTLE